MIAAKNLLTYNGLDMHYIYWIVTCVFFITLSACTNSYTLSCIYSPIESKENPYPELTQYDNCGRIVNNNIEIAEQQFKNIWFNEDNLAEIRILDGIYYLSTSKKLVKTHLFDNGADYFSEGLARTIKKNKYGFINKNLDTVIKPEYDFAFPFNDGKAIVCIGCVKNKIGEHTEMIDGQWGMIDIRGKTIVDIIHIRTNLDSIYRQYK